jgi:AcrR family transcriptional regulator
LNLLALPLRSVLARNRGAAPQQQRAIETRDALLHGAASVFARTPYAQARLKDIAEATGISEGALYFHFGNKSQVAEAILVAQQERMTAVLTRTLVGSGTGLEKLYAVMRGLAELIASDEIVQAGIKLAAEPAGELASAAHDPYFEWVRIARNLIQLGIDDGSVDAKADAEQAAEFINYAFVGAQVLSGMADVWVSLPTRLRVVERHVDALLSPHDAT